MYQPVNTDSRTIPEQVADLARQTTIKLGNTTHGGGRQLTEQSKMKITSDVSAIYASIAGEMIALDMVVDAVISRMVFH